MPRTFLKDVEPGSYLEDVFVITQKQLSTTQTGKPFIKCFVGDRTRSVPARMWNANQGAFNAMPDGGFLRVAGRVENYQDNIQFIIERFWILEGPHEVVLADLLPHTTRDIPQMFARVTHLLDSLRNSHLRAVARAYLEDEKLMEDFRVAPAAMSFHHAYIGGLLEHTLSMMELAEVIAPLYPLINRDVLLLGVFIHDLAKTWELSYAAGFGYTDGGHLVGHIAKGAIWLDAKCHRAGEAQGKPIPPAIVDVLQHIVLSHHGQPEYGAARVPATPEAILIHHIDNIDAKMMLSLAATRGQSVTETASFTEFNKAMGTRLYRPDVAPADVEPA